MSKFDPKINNISKENSLLTFELSGSESYGLDKSVVNFIRRSLLTDVPTVAFRYNQHNLIKDINITENTGTLHNEMITQRISLIPLYLDPDNYKNNYLFELKVKHDNTKLFKFVTSEDFNIYPLTSHIKKRLDNYEDDLNKSELDEILNSKNYENYDFKNPLSKKNKENIFRPFIFRETKNYCLITELKNTNAEDLSQGINLYGVPSISTGMENANFQPVSKVLYTFLKNDDLIESIWKERIKIEKIDPENQEMMKKKFILNESERYYHRDIHNEPYKYKFEIESSHYNNSEQLFIKTLQIIIDQIDYLKISFLHLLQEKENCISVSKINDVIFHFIINNTGHSMGNLIQNHIVRRCIDDDSLLQLCGYKKSHPLEESIKLIISLNPSHKIMKDTDKNKYQAIVTFLMEELDVLKNQYKLLLKESEKSFNL